MRCDGPLARRVIAPTVAPDAEIWRGSALLHGHLVGSMIRMSRASVAGKGALGAKALFWAGVGQWAKAQFSAGVLLYRIVHLCRTRERRPPSWAVAGKKVPGAKTLFLAGVGIGLKPSCTPIVPLRRSACHPDSASLPDAGLLSVELGCGWEESAQG